MDFVKPESSQSKQRGENKTLWQSLMDNPAKKVALLQEKIKNEPRLAEELKKEIQKSTTAGGDTLSSSVHFNSAKPHENDQTIPSHNFNGSPVSQNFQSADLSTSRRGPLQLLPLVPSISMSPSIAPTRRSGVGFTTPAAQIFRPHPGIQFGRGGGVGGDGIVRVQQSQQSSTLGSTLG